MKHQRSLGLRHPKAIRVYRAMLADSLEFSDAHLDFLKDRHSRYLESIK